MVYIHKGVIVRSSTDIISTKKMSQKDMVNLRSTLALEERQIAAQCSEGNERAARKRMAAFCSSNNSSLWLQCTVGRCNTSSWICQRWFPGRHCSSTVCDVLLAIPEHFQFIPVVLAGTFIPCSVPLFHNFLERNLVVNGVWLLCLNLPLTLNFEECSKHSRCTIAHPSF